MSERTQITHLGIYGIIRNDDNQIVVIRKARGPYTGMLDLPGGRPEFHETFEQTLAREILEETGLVVTACRQLTTLLYQGAYQDGEFRHVGILYECSAYGRLKHDGDEQDSHGSQWLEISAIETSNCTPFVNMWHDIYGKRYLF